MTSSPAPRPRALATQPDNAAGLTRQFAQVRARTVSLVETLSPEDCQAQSMPDASPAKWHLAHTTWFFETFVLEAHEPGFTPHDPAFRMLFNSYYEGIGPQHARAERGLITRPGLGDVLAYRTAVDERVEAVLACPHAPAVDELLTLGLHHEQQHQELLLTDLKHLLSQNPLLPAYRSRWPLTAVRPAAAAWQGFGGGWTNLGHDPALDGHFCFDNEGPRHRVHLDAFELATRPVSHGDWLAFMDDGGYRRPELWLSMGWDWVRAGQREAPMYWHRTGPEAPWHSFTLQGSVGVDPHTPLPHLSYFEADAYARWAGARLPTEAEWEHAARSVPVCGHDADRRAFHPLPDGGGAGLRQMFGDVWEWTQSAYAAYPRYQPAAGAIGEYNGKFMCNQFVLRGGSCVTPAGHVRASYRNFFPPGAQWQFSGLRLARDL